jgi:hypothetical protein
VAHRVAVFTYIGGMSENFPCTSLPYRPAHLKTPTKPAGTGQLILKRYAPSHTLQQSGIIIFIQKKYKSGLQKHSFGN